MKHDLKTIVSNTIRQSDDRLYADIPFRSSSGPSVIAMDLDGTSISVNKICDLE